MFRTILEHPSPKELREFLEAEYSKNPNWKGWGNLIEFYRSIGAGDYADELIKILDLGELLQPRKELK